jgi:uncharacterized protein (TIGR00369 family)
MTEFNGSNFVGGAWQNGFGLRFMTLPDNSVSALYTFHRNMMGPPGIVHGGALAAVLDEAMTAAVFAADRLAFTVNLNIDYRQPVHLLAEVKIVGQLERENGRKLYTSARIVLPDGHSAAEAKGLFIIAPDYPVVSEKK